MTTNGWQAITSIPKSRNRLVLMLIGKAFITGKYQQGDLNASHCNNFDGQIATANRSREIEGIFIKLQFTVIF
jgi:hypothetical protein